MTLDHWGHMVSLSLTLMTFDQHGASYLTRLWYLSRSLSLSLFLFLSLSYPHDFGPLGPHGSLALSLLPS